MTASHEPLCRSAENAAEPCRFATVCPETRQRIAHYASPSLRGMACWAFQHLSTRGEGGDGRTPPTLPSLTDEQVERAAIQETDA